VRVEITGLAGGGRGVARADGKVWLIADALPGETVETRVERSRAGVVEARALEIVGASPWREPDPCPRATECGGCTLAHVRREAAAEVLREVACGALRHAPALLGSAVRSAPVVVSPMAYRLRARLHWSARANTLGFLARRSHRAVEIAPCRVISPLLAKHLPPLSHALVRAGAASGELEWLEDLGGRDAVVGWLGGGSVPAPPIGSVRGWRALAPAGGAVPGGWGEEAVTMSLPVPLRVPIGAFFQGNRHLVPRLFERVAELVRASGCSRAVDLYAGVGFLAAAAQAAGVVDLTLIERNERAALAARENLPAADVRTRRAEEFLAEPGSGAGTLALADPPRTGLTRAAITALLAWRPQALVLLSCDAACFGRDAGRLLANGWALTFIELWDLFAGSHHVEIVACFRSAG
jgi:23S rRNA (uracil1939-C5)-methyltransferase